MVRQIFEFIPRQTRNRIISWFKYNYIRTDFEYKISLNEKNEFSGKSVLITGATGSIGTALCLAFASRGATIGVTGRDYSKVEKTIKFLKCISNDFKLIPIIINVNSDNQIREGIDKFANLNEGRIDCLINNAGGSERSNKALLVDLDLNIIDDVISTNLRGTMLCSKYVLPFMINNNYGRIINLSSVMGICGAPERTSYCASKSAIIGFTKSLALETGKNGVTVNSISPGLVIQSHMDRLSEGVKFTTGNCLGRWGYADEVASLAVFLSSNNASYITGQNISVDGGRSLGLK